METIFERIYIDGVHGIYSNVKIPKKFKEWDRKGYIYFIQIGDSKNHKFKIGTTCNIIQRMKQHLMNYKESIYILWISPAVSVYTTLGVSNVSFGLPNRPLLNRTFLTLALQAGLDLPIINPLDQQLMDTIDAYRVLTYQDQDAAQYIQHQSNQVEQSAVKTSSALSLFDIIVHGFKDEVKAKTEELLQTQNAMEIINQTIIPALNQVGKDYETNRIFLPQLIQSAETTKLAFEVVKATFSKQESSKATVLMCTVEGDIHDIGKNIVKVILESYGYEVIDLGKDVKMERVVEAYQQYHPQAIGLSALMTTTVVNMQKTIQALKAVNCQCPIWVGGAVLTSEIAREIGADYYCEDAMASVHLLQDIL